VFKSCKAGLGSSTGSSGQQALVRPRDAVPPVITVLGKGIRYVTPSGLTGMITTLFVGDSYTDEGATAVDEVPAAPGLASTLVAVAPFVSIRAPSGATLTSIPTENPTGKALSACAWHLHGC
jgi:hypothetical protein